MTGLALTSLYDTIHTARRDHNEAQASGLPYSASARDHADAQNLAQMILKENTP